MGVKVPTEPKLREEAGGGGRRLNLDRFPPPLPSGTTHDASWEADSRYAESG
jgi:hypothetical protein